MQRGDLWPSCRRRPCRRIGRIASITVINVLGKTVCIMIPNGCTTHTGFMIHFTILVCIHNDTTVPTTTTMQSMYDADWIHDLLLGPVCKRTTCDCYYVATISTI